MLFTLATGMTALAWGFVAFVALQMAARVFLSTEQALANLVVAEELRPDRRGAGLSALGIISGLGYGAVAGLLLLVPLTPLDWRLFYVVALLPLGVAAYLRRHLPETRAFQVAQAQHRVQTTLWPRVEPAHRKRLWQVVAIVGAFGLVQTSGFFYASELAQTDYGWNGLFTALILAAAVFGVLGFWLGGRISDLVGRRPMMALGIVLGAAGTVLVFTQVPALFTPGFFLLATAGSCFLAASVAYMAELFPTEVRASLTAFVIVCQVAAGSVGLVVLGGPRQRGEPVPAPAHPRRVPHRRPPGAEGPARDGPPRPGARRRPRPDGAGLGLAPGARAVGPEAPDVAVGVAGRELARAVVLVGEPADDLGPRRGGPVVERVGVVDDDVDAARGRAARTGRRRGRRR